MPGSFAQVCMLGHQSGAAEIAKPDGYIRGDAGEAYRREDWDRDRHLR